MKYPFAKMLPGQTKSKTFPARLDAVRARTAAYAHARTHHKKFVCTLIDTKLSVKYVCGVRTIDYQPLYLRWARDPTGQFPNFDGVAQLKPGQTLTIEFLKLSHMRECKRRLTNFCHANRWIALLREHSSAGLHGILLEVKRLPIIATRNGLVDVNTGKHRTPWNMFGINDHIVVPIPAQYPKFVNDVRSSIYGYAKRHKKQFATQVVDNRLEITRLE